MYRLEQHTVSAPETHSTRFMANRSDFVLHRVGHIKDSLAGVRIAEKFSDSQGCIKTLESANLSKAARARHGVLIDDGPGELLCELAALACPILTPQSKADAAPEGISPTISTRTFGNHRMRPHCSFAY